MNGDEPAFEQALFADMRRLGERPYSEVGVPMFLIAEDLRGARARRAEPGGAELGGGELGGAELGGAELAATLRRMGDALARRDPDLTAADAARLVEVLADRHLLGGDAAPFTTPRAPEDDR